MKKDDPGKHPKGWNKRIMAGHWVGNVFVMCWSQKSRMHELAEKCEEAIQKSNEANVCFQFSLDRINKR